MLAFDRRGKLDNPRKTHEVGPEANSKFKKEDHQPDKNHTHTLRCPSAYWPSHQPTCNFFIPGVEVFPRIFPHYARVGWGRVAWEFDCVKFPYGDFDLYFLYRVLTILVRVKH